MDYEKRRKRASEIREQLAMALLFGDRRPDVMEDLREAGREVDILTDAIALRKYRNGEPVWVWPKQAPWVGF